MCLHRVISWYVDFHRPTPSDSLVRHMFTPSDFLVGNVKLNRLAPSDSWVRHVDLHRQTPSDSLVNLHSHFIGDTPSPCTPPTYLDRWWNDWIQETVDNSVCTDVHEVVAEEAHCGIPSHIPELSSEPRINEWLPQQYRIKMDDFVFDRGYSVRTKSWECVLYDVIWCDGKEVNGYNNEGIRWMRWGDTSEWMRLWGKTS